MTRNDISTDHKRGLFFLSELGRGQLTDATLDFDDELDFDDADEDDDIFGDNRQARKMASMPGRKYSMVLRMYMRT